MIDDIGAAPLLDTRHRRLISPEPRCESHRMGRCACEDDGSGAGELVPEDEQR